MSSTYQILCLSHDPAIDLDQEYQSGLDGRAAVMGLLDHRIGQPIPGHDRCDLVAGRFSYPLIEVYCPAQTAETCRSTHGTGVHRGGEWIEVTWLRLLYAVQSQTPHLLGHGVDHMCWPPERLRRLRLHLDPDGTWSK